MPKRVTIPGVGTVNFPDDMPDDQVHAESEKLYAQAQPKTAAAEATPSAAPDDARHPSSWTGMAKELALTAIPLYGVARQAGLDLPTAGGIAGGIATGGAGLIPMALAAGAGGGAGSLAQSAIDYFRGAKPNATLGSVAKDAAVAAAVQGGAQLAGGALAKGAGALGRGLYTKALAPAKALTREFPDLIETGIAEGAIPNTESGVARTAAARTASANEARNLLRASPAAKAGVRVTTPSLAQGLDPLRASVAAQPEANVAQQQIGDFANNLAASHPRGFTLEDLLATKQAAQGQAQAAYKAAQQGGNRAAGMESQANEAIASRARQILEQFAPNTRGANAKTQSLIGLTRALEDAQTRPYVLRTLLSGTAGISEGVRERDPMAGLKTAAGTFIATDPRVMGTAGIALGRMGGGSGQIPANLLRATPIPDAIRAAILSQMGQDDQAQP
jgi:hypothetical protein